MSCATSTISKSSSSLRTCLQIARCRQSEELIRKISTGGVTWVPKTNYSTIALPPGKNSFITLCNKKQVGEKTIVSCLPKSNKMLLGAPKKNAVAFSTRSSRRPVNSGAIHKRRQKTTLANSSSHRRYKAGSGGGAAAAGRRAGHSTISSNAASTMGSRGNGNSNAALFWGRFFDKGQLVLRLRELKSTVNSILLKPRTIGIPRWVSPRHYSITMAECFGHASFILVAFSYAVDDFLMLRCIAVVGSTSMLLFTYFHPHGRVLWLPFKWNLLFILINSYRIGKVYLDRYYAEKLSSELLEIRDSHFYLMDPVDFKKLVSCARIEHHKKDSVLVSQSENNRYIRLVLSGTLSVLRDDLLNYNLEEGNFIAETGLHAGLLLTGFVSSCCTIKADTDDVVTLRWDRTELVDMLNRQPGVLRSLKAVLSWDIMRKLKAQRKLLGTGKVDDPEAWTKRRSDQTQHRYASILYNLLYSTPCSYSTRKVVINKYRMTHQIDDETHIEALRHLGWTPEEFEAGVKKNGHNGNSNKEKNHTIPQILLRRMSATRSGKSMDDNDEDIVVDCNADTHDLKWYVKDMYLRLVG